MTLLFTGGGEQGGERLNLCKYSVSHHTFTGQFYHPLMILACSNYYCGVFQMVIFYFYHPFSIC